MNIEKTIPSDQELVNIFGVNDQNLNYLKSLFPKLEINVRSNVIYINGNTPDTEEATRILDEMLIMGSKNKTIEIPDLELIAKIRQPEKLSKSKISQLNVIDNKFIKVKNINQFKYLETIDDSTITFGVGPAGTGKTFLAVACAVDDLMQEKIRKIVLVRPAVEAGEKLGFLPGDLSSKIDPYLRPLYDALHDMLGAERVNRLVERDIIEIAPLAYMRGRTLREAFIIMDEGQNTTIEQMKMFLTRLGFGSKAVVNGDLSQIDLPKSTTSGLKHAIEVLKDVDSIKFTKFSARDVVRHSLVQEIVEAYDNFN